MTRSAEIGRSLDEVRSRIEAALRRSGRPESAVTLVAVAKTKPLADLHSAYEAGVRNFGENRVQEAESKFPFLAADAVGHLIGPIQSNKANRAAAVARVIQTVDSTGLALRLERAAEKLGRTLPVFIEVNTGGEKSKAGVSPGELAGLAATVRSSAHLSLRGLMTIPPPGQTRPHFVRLRALAESEGISELSMGMSEDFEAAIEEGATLVRIGSALFGAR